MTRKGLSYNLLLGILLFFSWAVACKPKKLENGRAIAEEVERRTVKRFTEKQIVAEAKRLGDSLTHFADSLSNVRLQRSLAAGGLAVALTHYPPERYPEVKAFAQKYAANPQRKKPDPAANLTKGARISPLSQTEVLYTKPIFLNQKICASCHGPAVPDADKQLLQQHFPAFNLLGYKPGQLLGEWYIPIKRKGILESLTLRDMKKPRQQSED